MSRVNEKGENKQEKVAACEENKERRGREKKRLGGEVNLWHLVQFERGLGGLAGAAAVPVVGAAAAVASAAFDQQAAREEDGVGGPQLLTQVHRVVARGAAVPLDVVVQTVQVD